MSDPRNPNVQKMFQMLGLGEKAGSGFQKILRAWREQHWIIPLVAEDPSLEMTRVWLPLASMIPGDVEQELRAIVGEAYRGLDELGRVILMLAHRFDEIGNADIQPYRAEHPREIGVRLKQFVDAGCLEKGGHGRGTRYRWPRQHLGDLFAPTTPVGEGSEHSAASSEQSTADSEHLKADSEHLSSEQEARLAALAAPMRKLGKVSNKAQAEQVILALCSQQWLALRTLARLLDRAPDSLRNHYINPMLRDGRLRARVPGTPNHPGQAYKTNE